MARSFRLELQWLIYFPLPVSHLWWLLQLGLWLPRITLIQIQHILLFVCLKPLRHLRWVRKDFFRRLMGKLVR